MITKIRKFKKTKVPSLFRRKRSIAFSRTILFPTISVLVILIVIGFLIASNWRINKKRSELNLKIENLKNEIEVLEEKRQELSAGISQIPTESYLEKEARERFNLKKQGEEVVVVLPPEESQEEKAEEKKSLWQRILEKLGL